MRQLCAQGYYGPVCSLCISSGDVTYGRVGGLQCQPCRRTVSIISAYIASALLVLAWLSYTIHVTLVENEEAAAGHDDPQYTSQLIRVRPESALNVLSKCQAEVRRSADALSSALAVFALFCRPFSPAVLRSSTVPLLTLAFQLSTTVWLWKVGRAGVGGGGWGGVG